MRWCWIAGCFLSLLIATHARAADPVLIANPGTAGVFPLVANKQASEIFYDANDYKVVQIACELLASDVQKVTGVKPRVHRSNDKAGDMGKQVVYAGTLGHSPTIDGFVANKKIDAFKIKGQWESYLIATLANPEPGVDQGLLVIGSDRRGTAYGLLTLSEQMGVSPWEWWADVPVVHRDEIHVAAGPHVHGPPSVQYRGIFINDEDWGLQPWAAKTFEPVSAGGTGDIGPKTYAKIFELLLRLKANFCWPAMHDVTKAFNIYPQNKQVADDYAIVMGSSHCEPMLRNNVTEWGQANAASYNYVTNRQGVLDYWRKRVEENGKFENVYTLGMRGIHDSDMAGGGTREQRVERLKQIMTDQRQMIRDILNPDVTKVPQIFCPYKEVLTLYQAGAVPPEDVTLVWADDNHGYIRQLSTPEEQRRPGGAGVYYHISYWGAPHDYLWLCTTPPALVWEELSKAYDYNARKLWVINVGDIKPAEIDLTLAMQMAWDIDRWNINTIAGYLKEFATRTFGPEHAGEIADILQTYYRLNYLRKPEHMGFNTSQGPATPVQPSPFSDEEVESRMLSFRGLFQQADNVYKKLPPEQRDAFYELIYYPVYCSASQNVKWLGFEIFRRGAPDGELSDIAVAMSRAAHEGIQTETAYYNNTLAGGKWKNMMSANPHNADVFKLPAFATPGPQHLPALENSYRPASTQGTPAAMAGSFVEIKGCISLAAEHFTRKIDRESAAWRTITGLGRLGDSVAVYPTTTPSVTDPKVLATTAPILEYDFHPTESATRNATITVQAIPTHRINPERGLRYAVAIDDEAPQIVDLETPENNRVWAENVLRGSAFGVTTHKIAAGKHTLRIYMVDPGVVLDHITIDLGGLKKSYLPPPETRIER